jgi:hypothetical protein
MFISNPVAPLQSFRYCVIFRVTEPERRRTLTFGRTRTHTHTHTHTHTYTTFSDQVLFKLINWMLQSSLTDLTIAYRGMDSTRLVQTRKVHHHIHKSLLLAISAFLKINFPNMKGAHHRCPLLFTAVTQYRSASALHGYEKTQPY